MQRFGINWSRGFSTFPPFFTLNCHHPPDSTPLFLLYIPLIELFCNLKMVEDSIDSSAATAAHRRGMDKTRCPAVSYQTAGYNTLFFLIEEMDEEEEEGRGLGCSTDGK